MKRTTVYWILFFGFLVAISWIYTAENNTTEPFLRKQDYNSRFSKIERDDFYVIKDKEGEIYRFFKIVENTTEGYKFKPLAGNPDYKIIEKPERAQKITILEGNLAYKDKFDQEIWIKRAIESSIYFEPELTTIFKDFLIGLRASTDDYMIYRLSYPPDELPMLLKLFLSPAMVFAWILILLLLIWMTESITLYLSNRFEQISKLLILVVTGTILSELAFSVINTMLSYGHSNYLIALDVDITERSIITSTIGVTLILIPFFLLFRLAKRKFLGYLNFADQEFFKFLLILIGGLIYAILGISIVFWARELFFDTLVYQNPTPQDFYGDFMPIVLIEGILTCGMIAIANFLNNLRKHVQQLKFKEKLLIQSEQAALSSQSALDALQARVNPHFLYNSLNSIASLAQINPAKTEEMALALSDFYKHSTNRQEEHISTVETEIKQLQTYLNIEKIRFGDRLQYHLDIAENAQKMTIPRFLLQPLVENAIKYGFNTAKNKIEITIEGIVLNGQLHLRIMDSGPSFSGTLNTGYGLRGVKKKLKLLYRNAHEIHFLNAPTKQVHIILETAKIRLYA